MSNSAISGNNTSLDETKIIYHIDEEETPYLIKISAAPDKVTLGDFRNALNRPHYKYFFKSMDDDFGVVKEEISDDNARLPCFNGRVISWLVTAEGSTVSDDFGQNLTTGETGSKERQNESRHVPFHESHNHIITTSQANNNKINATVISVGAGNTTGTNGESDTVCDTCTDTDSVYSAAQDRIGPLRSFHDYKHAGRTSSHHNRLNPTPNGPNPIYETNSSMMSSDLESTSFFDSEDESSRFSTTTGTTLSSRYGRQRQQRRRRRPPAISRASSFSSITDSTMSLNIITVRLNMDTVKFLGISIVGQSNKGGDGGIYVGSIMKGGAVAQDGRIEPGDMILEVNDISFEDMSNDDAVKTLREEVQKAGPITLVVAKCWDPNPKGYFTIPRQEPVRPIDPRAWVLHTNAMTTGGLTPTPLSNGVANGVGVENGSTNPNNLVAPSMQSLLSGGTMLAGTSAATFNAGYPSQPPPPPPIVGQGSLTQPSTNGPSQPINSQNGPFYPPGVTGQFSQGAGSIVTTSSSLPESERYQEELHLTVNTDISVVVRVMAQPDSGLDIRDRLWLKITLPNAFIGSDLVDWLYRHVEGFPDRKEARKYAATLLKFGYIRHTVNKVTFSEQCYYVLGDGIGISRLSLDHVDSVSEAGAIQSHHQPHHPQHHHPHHHLHHPTSMMQSYAHNHQQLAALPPPNWSSLTSTANNQLPTASSSIIAPISNDNTLPPPPPPVPNNITPTTTATASSNSQYSVVGPPLQPPGVGGAVLSNNIVSTVTSTPALDPTTSNINNSALKQSNSCHSLTSSSSSSSSTSSSSSGRNHNNNSRINGKNQVTNKNIQTPPKPPPRTMANCDLLPSGASSNITVSNSIGTSSTTNTNMNPSSFGQSAS